MKILGPGLSLFLCGRERCSLFPLPSKVLSSFSSLIGSFCCVSCKDAFIESGTESSDALKWLQLLTCVLTCSCESAFTPGTGSAINSM